MKVSRTSRLNGEYQKEISAIVSGKLKNRDPRLTGLISVTEADVAPDLKTANFFAFRGQKKTRFSDSERERGFYPSRTLAGDADAHRSRAYFPPGREHGIRL